MFLNSYLNFIYLFIIIQVEDDKVISKFRVSNMIMYKTSYIIVQYLVFDYFDGITVMFA